jgi:hypothetical protein
MGGDLQDPGDIIKSQNLILYLADNSIEMSTFESSRSHYLRVNSSLIDEAASPLLRFPQKGSTSAPSNETPPISDGRPNGLIRSWWKDHPISSGRQSQRVSYPYMHLTTTKRTQTVTASLPLQLEISSDRDVTAS